MFVSLVMTMGPTILERLCLVKWKDPADVLPAGPWDQGPGRAVLMMVPTLLLQDLRIDDALRQAAFQHRDGVVDRQQEDRVNAFYTYGVKHGRLDLHRFVDAASTQAARLFGLYPRKGTIQPGSDADLVFRAPMTEGLISK